MKVGLDLAVLHDIWFQIKHSITNFPCIEPIDCRVACASAEAGAKVEVIVSQHWRLLVPNWASLTRRSRQTNLEIVVALWRANRSFAATTIRQARIWIFVRQQFQTEFARAQGFLQQKNTLVFRTVSQRGGCHSGVTETFRPPRNLVKWGPYVGTSLCRDFLLVGGAKKIETTPFGSLEKAPVLQIAQFNS